MRKSTLILGVVLTCIIALGVLFRIMHWPGSSPMIVLGIGSVMTIFLPMLLIHRLKTDKTALERGTAIFGFITGFLFLFPGLLFSIQRWPGGVVMIYGGILFGLVFLFLFLLSRKKSGKPVFAIESFSLIIVSMLLVLFGGRFVVKQRSADKAHENMIAYAEAFKEQRRMVQEADHAFSEIMAGNNDTATIRAAQHLHYETVQLLQYIYKMRAEVVARNMGIPESMADTLSMSLIERPTDYDTPTHYFIGEDPNNITGKAKDLQIALTQYLNDNYERQQVEKIVPRTIYIEETGVEISWASYNFYHKSIVEALTTLLKIQTNILKADKAALEKKEFKK